MSELIPAPERHVCDLPDAQNNEGSLASCRTCGTWWHGVWCYQGFGGGVEWRQVFWWHWRLRRRIAASRRLSGGEH